MLVFFLCLMPRTHGVVSCMLSILCAKKNIDQVVFYDKPEWPAVIAAAAEAALGGGRRLHESMTEMLSAKNRNQQSLV